MKPSEATRLVAMLQAHDPKHDTTEATLEVWAMALDDVPYPVAMTAVREWIKHHKWFPFPTEIRAIAAEQLTGIPSAEDAWATVMARMKATYPGHPAPAWDAPAIVIEATERIGGISALRLSTQPIKDQERFAAIYGAMRERVLRETDIAALWTRLGDGAPAIGGGDATN